jgi:hypothetical protein
LLSADILTFWKKRGDRSTAFGNRSKMAIDPHILALDPLDTLQLSLMHLKPNFNGFACVSIRT